MNRTLLSKLPDGWEIQKMGETKHYSTRIFFKEKTRGNAYLLVYPKGYDRWRRPTWTHNGQPYHAGAPAQFMVYDLTGFYPKPIGGFKNFNEARHHVLTLIYLGL